MKPIDTLVFKAGRVSGYFRNKVRRLDPTERRFDEVWPVIDAIEGFLASPMQERWLFKTATNLPNDSTIVEIGSFKGRSTVCLAFGCEGTDKHVYAIDTFDGNEVDFHYRDFYDDFLKNIADAGLADYVTPLKGRSAEVGRAWNKPIDLLFVDASHVFEDVVVDFETYFPHVVPGGIVAVHDVSDAHPGCLLAWDKEIGHRLSNTDFCHSLAFGYKPPQG